MASGITYFVGNYDNGSYKYIYNVIEYKQAIMDACGFTNPTAEVTSISYACEKKTGDAYFPITYCYNLLHGSAAMEISAEMSYNSTGLDSTQVTWDNGYPITVLSEGASVISGAEFNNDTEHDNNPFTCDVSLGSIEWLNGAGDPVNTYNIPIDAVRFSNVRLYVEHDGNTITGYTYIWDYRGGTYVSGLQSDSAVLEILNGGSAITDKVTKVTLEADDIELSNWWVGLRNTSGGSEPGTGNGVIYYGLGNRYHPTGKDDMETLFTDTIIPLNEGAGGFEGTDFSEQIIALIKDATFGQIGSFTNTETNETFPIVFAGANVTADENEWGVALTQYHVYILQPPAEGSEEGTPYTTYNDTQLYTSTFINSGDGYESVPIYLCYIPQSEEFATGTSTLCWTNIIQIQDTAITWTYAYNLGGTINTEEIISEDDYNVDYSSDEWEEESGNSTDDGEEDSEEEDPPEDEETSILSSGFLYGFILDNASADMEHLRDCLSVEGLKEAIKNDYGNNLYDFIVSLHKVPCYPKDYELKTLTYDDVAFTYGEGTNLTLRSISNDKVVIECGTVHVFLNGIGDTTADFYQYGDVFIYLPFIGVKQLNVADVYGKDLTLTYRIDVVNGTCTANLYNGTLGTFASYSGQCRKTVPYTKTVDASAQNIIAGVVQSVSAAGQVGIAIASHGASGIDGAIGSAVNAGQSFARAYFHKAEIEKGGSLAGSNGWDGSRTPCIFMTCPSNTFNNNKGTLDNYRKTVGYPSCAGVSVGALSDGSYNEFLNIDLSGIPARESELLQIQNILTGGFYK